MDVNEWAASLTDEQRAELAAMDDEQIMEYLSEEGVELPDEALEGIAGGVTCAPMMMTTAFSLVIVTLEDGADADAVCADFENTMNWRKWVCVAPSNAMIAQKDNMVLCVMADGPMYTKIAVAARQAGWTEVKALMNPDR